MQTAGYNDTRTVEYSFMLRWSLWLSMTFSLNLPQHTVFSSHILDEKKAIKAWVFSNDAYHLFIVTFYFQISAQWEQVKIKELKSKTRKNSDILYAVQGIKKSSE